MAISLDDAKRITDAFIKSYPSLTTKLGFLFRETTREIHTGVDETIKGALLISAQDKWHAQTQKTLHAEVWGILENASSAKDFLETLNHEVLGHYALNAVEPIKKRLVLSHIKEAQKDPKMRELWDKVNVMYKDAPLDIKAEEVYCLNAERITPNMMIDKERVNKQGAASYRETCLQNLRPFTREDLTNITLWHVQQVMELNKTLQPLPGIQAYQQQHTTDKEIIR